MVLEELNTREQQLLATLIRAYIRTAAPVGSAQLAEISQLGLKPASIRRLLAGLEEKGYITQPHTSAGRLPTTKGYRYYVDRLVKFRKVRSDTASLIRQTLNTFDGDINRLMGQIAQVLARISKQLGIIVTPNLYQGVLDRIQLVPVSAARIMVIMTLKEGPVNTIVMELQEKIDHETLHKIVRRINRQFHGKSLNEIRLMFTPMLQDMRDVPRGAVKLFIDVADRLLDMNRYESYQVVGTSYIVHHPEFSDMRRFSTLVELLEDRNIVIHFMEKRENPPGTRITIGQEHSEKQIQYCSVITSTYQVGAISGVLGIIGPTRMAYARLIPLVEYTARALSEKLRA